ncbi:uncharacterized protein LOC116445393 isoform X1 [Corvus moneduloides]|uniref:uncharacterized protein LOC116445393 isoform X1 n=1 Tax=Corvus moneduloides TaxID=1196302 RepID=UPI001362384D|nr:uncharacterized protein LOC116445393 isoform X1 [Corvus moneduloides]XP_031967877.1 uncharacterized protein LOC116445393 isoform X1 [Corvus moneduloides]XP_031967878.1 uncharacterized protein LOC116445393 isoform X1 [Corvus moneduloides]XP_031967879.1 uncharacterized protein LOC116445393 isoform X1 [Corvus moneduloides]
MKFQGCSPCWSEKQWKHFAVCFFIAFASVPWGSRTGKTTELVPSLGPRALVLEQPKPARAPLVLPVVWLLLEFEHNLFLSRSPASLGQDLSQSLLGPGSEREAANGAGEFLGALWQRTSRTASSPSWTAGMPSIALVSEWEWLLGALAGPAPFQGKADERIKMQRNKCCKPPRLSDRANLPVMPVHRSERLWDHKVFQESKTRTEMWE